MEMTLRTRAALFFMGLAIVPLLLVGIVLVIQTINVQGEQAVALQDETALRVAKEVESLLKQRESDLRFFTDVRGIQSVGREEQTALLSGLLAASSAYNELALLDAQGKELVRVSQLSVISAKELGSRAGQAEFEQPNLTQATYYSSVQLDEQTGEPFLIISIPTYDLQTGKFNGVLAGNVRFKPVWDLMSQVRVVGSGVPYMVDASTRRVVAHRNPSVVLRGTEAGQLVGNFTTGLDGSSVAMGTSEITLGDQVFNIVVELPAFEARALAINTIIIIGISILIAGGAAATLGILLSRQITNPIESLALAANALSQGDLTSRAPIVSSDELGTLARAFNTMADQIQEVVGTLEQRVAERTRALETSIEVSRRLSASVNPAQLAVEVVQQLQAAFNYYHAHIYFYDDSQENLVMAGGTGEAGAAMLASGHSIPKGRGLVGRAAETNQPVLVPDVTQSIGWLPNPLLPDTKAEAAVPIAIGEQVLGVLDVQQNVVHGLGEQDIALLQSLSAQVAISLQNARSFDVSRARADLESMVNAIGQKIQRTDSVQETLQTAVRELGLALGAPRVSVKIGAIDQDELVFQGEGWNASRANSSSGNSSEGQ
jgi:putative methionine-R-sulfoxide reductase with GAF domain